MGEVHIELLSLKNSMQLYNAHHRSRGNSSRVGHSFYSSILIHLPFGFLPRRSFPLIENHCFLHSDHSVIGGVDIAGRPCCLPVARSSSSVSSPTSSFPLLSWCEVKPLLSVSSTTLPRKLCDKRRNMLTY